MLGLILYGNTVHGFKARRCEEPNTPTKQVRETISRQLWKLGSPVRQCAAALMRSDTGLHGVPLHGIATGRESHDHSARRLGRVVSATALCTHRGYSEAVLAVARDSDEKSAVLAARDGTIRVWQLGAGERRATTRQELHLQWGSAASVLGTGIGAAGVPNVLRGTGPSTV
ncbi:hypothetical protein [Azohydromonas australica]|uniref:hypothetical protein n=1 Tax=Azohydromonas australica TaxID=364039 RepID=UPI0012EC12D8|nr:hypothetical protein [Azohydromonas australica]